MELVEVGLHLMLVHDGVHELHPVDLVQNLVMGGARQKCLDHGHGDFGVLLLCLDDNSVATIEELADGLHHAERLVQRAVVIVLRERVLL